MTNPRQMTLTPDLVAQVPRVLEDPGPDPTWVYHVDEDNDAVIQASRAPIPMGLGPEQELLPNTR